MSSRNFSLRLSLFNAVLFLGAGIQLPFLPLWLKDRGLSDAEVALVVGLMMAVRIIGIPFGTFIADLTQRRRAVIIACAFGATAAYLLLNVVSGFWPSYSAACWPPLCLLPSCP